MKNQRLKLIIGLVVIGLLLFSVIFSRLRHKNYKTSHKDDVEVTISRDDVTEEEIEESVKIEAANTDFTIVGGVLEKYSGESTIVAVPNNVREIATDAFRGLS